MRLRAKLKTKTENYLIKCACETTTISLNCNFSEFNEKFISQIPFILSIVIQPESEQPVMHTVYAHTSVCVCVHVPCIACMLEFMLCIGAVFKFSLRLSFAILLLFLLFLCCSMALHAKSSVDYIFSSHNDIAVCTTMALK